MINRISKYLIALMPIVIFAEEVQAVNPLLKDLDSVRRNLKSTSVAPPATAGMSNVLASIQNKGQGRSRSSNMVGQATTTNASRPHFLANIGDGVQLRSSSRAIRSHTPNFTDPNNLYTIEAGIVDRLIEVGRQMTPPAPAVVNIQLIASFTIFQ